MIVLDSSVALKWIFADEDGAEHAFRAREDHISGKNEIVVPNLFFYEIANVLATKVDLSAEESLVGFDLIRSFELDARELSNTEFKEAMSLSMMYKVSAYEASYHVLAANLECPFLTADQKFWKKVDGLGVAKLLSTDLRINY